MEPWKHIQRAVDHIEQHIGEEIEISQLAKLCYLSQFYFMRLFKRMTGKPVMEYIRLRRLARAVDLLDRSDLKVSEVAANFGFENHETFTRAFKEAFKTTPSAYRRQKSPLVLMKAPDLSTQHYLKDLHEPVIIDGLVFDIRRASQQSPRHFAAATALFAQATDELTGVNAPPGFDGWTMPVADYIVCCVEAEELEPLLNEACPLIKGYMLSDWAQKNRISFDPAVATVVYERGDDVIYLELYFRIDATEGDASGLSEYSAYLESQLVELEADVIVVGIGLTDSGLPLEFESMARLWDKKEVYTEAVQNGIRNTRRPIVEYGISLGEDPYYLVGREVTEPGQQDARYRSIAIKAGRYVKTAFNAESFDQMVSERLGEAFATGRQWAGEQGLAVDEAMSIEVYPYQTTMARHPGMYVLLPLLAG